MKYTMEGAVIPSEWCEPKTFQNNATTSGESLDVHRSPPYTVSLED